MHRWEALRGRVAECDRAVYGFQPNRVGGGGTNFDLAVQSKVVPWVTVRGRALVHLPSYVLVAHPDVRGVARAIALAI